LADDRLAGEPALFHIIITYTTARGGERCAAIGSTQFAIGLFGMAYAP
jgi:hypothetical protein